MRPAGRVIQIPTISPNSDVTVPAPEAHSTTRFHKGPFSRSGVKYNQCGIAPNQAPRREALVVDCTTSPVRCETYTSFPSGHEYLSNGRRRRNSPLTVH